MDRRDPDGSVIQRLLNMCGATIEYNALSAKAREPPSNHLET
jgi:hypothetical protein